MIKFYLFDIEGTTTDINFVHKVLFPYSAERMEDYILHHQTHPQVQKSLESVRQTVMEENQKQLGLHECISQLRTWIKEDRKHPALKELQGLIWDYGYTNNHFQGHLYPDVLPFFKKILSIGSKVAIYSSGSVHAQKLIFGYSIDGDLTPFISNYFDTNVGHKREKASYLNIVKELGVEPKEIHFFSDIPEELKAASDAGLSITHVLREGCQPSEYDCVTDFRSLLERL